MNIIGRDVSETGIGSEYCSGPCRWNQRRPSRHPVVAACADTTCDPTHARLQHNLIDRCTANAEVHVVVHLKTLDAVEDLHHRTRLSLAQDERVVDEAI